MYSQTGFCFVLCVMVATTALCKSDDDAFDEFRASRVRRDADSDSFAKTVQDTVPKSGGDYIIRITTILHPPYVMQTDDGNFTGFLPDLIEEMFDRADPRRKIKYQFYLSPDFKYGAKFSNGTWNGMIGELTKNENGSTTTGAHIAAAPLTITSTRQQVVDFLQPFSHNTLTFVIQKPHRADKPANASVEEQEEIFKFNFNIFKPLEPSVWILVTVLLIVVWLFTWLMNYFNPYEYGERYKRNLATEDEAQYFNITGSLWYTFTILQWQGFDRAPRSMAAKLLGCMWMVFVTVTLVTYMGSLFNMLFWASNFHGNKDPLIPPVRDLRDLVSHKDGYTYGMLRSGSTWHYINEVARGDDVVHLRDYLNSEEGKQSFVNSYFEGLQKVRNEKYALLMESPMAEYEISQRPCDLMSTRINLGMSSFGIALPKNAPYAAELHKMLLEMIETGELESIKERWFNNRQCWNVTAMEKAVSVAQSVVYMNKAQAVNISMFWSPLVIMVVGIVLSIVVAIAEILWYKYRGRYDARNRQRGHQLTNEDDGHI